MTAQGTAQARRIEPTGIVCFRQADVGEYLREVSRPGEIRRECGKLADWLIGGYAVYNDVDSFQGIDVQREVSWSADVLSMD